MFSAALPQAGKVIWLDNPATGERYAVAPSSIGPVGSPRSRRFVEFSLLPSLQGLVISQIADDLTVTSNLDEVVIARSEGLAITQDQAVLAAAPDRKSELLIDPAVWEQQTKGDLRSQERQLFAEAAEAPQRERTAKRLALAKFYLANQLPAEAIGVIDTVMKDDPAAAADERVKMTRAIAFALAKLPDSALRALSDKALTDTAEAALWRGFIAANAQDWTAALVSYRKGLPMLDLYPERLQAMFRPQLVNAAIEAEDINFASDQLDRYERLRSGTERADKADLLRGRIAEANGRVDDALGLYDRAAKSDDRDVEARGRLHRILLQHKDKRVTDAQAEAELETLGVIWAGDELELRSLDTLSSLYASKGQWREAFAATRRALEINSEHRITRALQDKTSAKFEELFLSGKADELDKIKSLALYYDFRNFTPPGRKGDEIVRYLADRLIELDLLEEASTLLAHQVQHRLEGAARASVATNRHRLPAGPEAVEALRIIKETRSRPCPRN